MWRSWRGRVQQLSPTVTTCVCVFCFLAAVESAKFLPGDAKREEPILQRLLAIVQLKQANENMWGGDEFTDTWMGSIATRVRARDVCLKIEAESTQMPVESLDSLCAAYRVALHETDTLLAERKVVAARLLHSRIDSMTEKLRAVAGGDPHKTGGSWLQGTPLSEWTDWQELVVQYNASVRQ